MKNLTKKTLAAASLAVAVTAVSLMSVPSTTAAFTTIGGSLSTSQRDFRVFNNFTGGAANNNTTANASFPGALGAEMSLWKGVIEWASEPWAGTGLGDGAGSNPNLGDGGANFDAHYNGEHTAAGNSNGNVISFQTASCGGSTLAFMQGPISDGWTIKFCPGWSWQDGPGTVSGVDIQGVGCHEYGHALGLGHTSTSGATMFASVSGSGVAQRSIASDDIAGVQSIYGVKSGTKPRITSLSGSFDIGTSLTITGVNFSTTGNEAWFTDVLHDGTKIIVSGLSSTGGGTQIVVTVPSGADDGTVIVKKSGSGNSSLSDAWPIDVGSGAGPQPPALSSVNPPTGPAGGFTEVVITGSNLSGVTDVDFGTSNAKSFTVDSSTQITAVTPSGTPLALVDVTVTNTVGSDTLPTAYFYTGNPGVNISTVSPDTGNISGGDLITITGGNVLGVTSVTFGGVAGTNLNIVAPDELRVNAPAGAGAGPVDVVATGVGSDTIVDGYTYTSNGAFVGIGSGLAGTNGFVPFLSGGGDLTPGGTGFNMNTVGIKAFAPGVTFISLSQGAAPFKGGVLYTVPILLQFDVTASLFGTVVIPGVIDISIPNGISFFVQQVFSDVGAVKGVSMSNGLELQVP